MTGIILAGGKNTRMGCHKAFIEICGERVINRIYRTLEKVTSNII
ncbi:MAG: NTP transferase domain-containing protein, partial [Candidatus Desulfofervidaceae bacterium]|nr:NTP transferase domain-containing protein [Candidatus Desulfofervidaceae bacterium]